MTAEGQIDARSANDPMTAEGQIDARSANDYPGWYMEMQELGYNYRLTDFQAALGLSQLKRADEGLQKRKEIATRYDKAFAGMFKSHKVNDPMTTNDARSANDQMTNDSMTTNNARSANDPMTNDSMTTNNARSANNPITNNNPGHAYHLYIIETEKRKELYDHLRKYNIFAQVHYIPVHLMPYYRQFGWKEGDLPNAEKYYNQCLSLPMYPTLSEEEQTFVIKTITDFF
jgi:dTDP-4-amino-4,6-dideoxygalactose transaminase